MVPAATIATLIVWVGLLWVQTVLYTPLAEFLCYLAIWCALSLAAVFYVPNLQSGLLKFAATGLIAIILGFMPYGRKLDGIMLFLFHGAKNEYVTYDTDPYMNVEHLFWILIFPISHFFLASLMVAIRGRS